MDHDVIPHQIPTPEQDVVLGAWQSFTMCLHQGAIPFQIPERARASKQHERTGIIANANRRDFWRGFKRHAFHQVDAGRGQLIVGVVDGGKRRSMHQ